MTGYKYITAVSHWDHWEAVNTMILNAFMSGLFLCSDKEHVFIDTDITNNYIALKNVELYYLTVKTIEQQIPL